jgi:hypothetical protein
MYKIDHLLPFAHGIILGTIYGRGCLAVWGKGAPMPKRLAKKPDRNCDHSFSQSQEPLPPYELDQMFDDPVIRNRIGEVIAKAAKKRICKI